MALKGRRPNGPVLQAHVQQNLHGTLAAHRQHLQQALPRPPQLPGIGSGYPPASPEGRATSTGATVRTPQRRGSSSSSAHAALPGSTTVTSPAHSRSRRQGRADSLEAKAGSSRPVRSPSAASEGTRQSPQASEAGELGLEGNEDEDDEALWMELFKLQELSTHLGLSSAEEGGSSSSTAVPRPSTGGTSSASTTVRGGSSMGCATSEEEPSGDMGLEGSCCLEETELCIPGWTGAVRASYELQSLRLPHGCRVEHTPGSQGQFFFIVDVAEGPYTPATLTFWVKVFEDFPSSGSCSVRCTQRIFHPSVDPSSGRVSVPDDAYMDDDKALASLLTTVRQLILTPKDSPAANQDAALLLQTDPDEFRRLVRFTLNGGQHRGVHYDRALGKSSTVAASRDPAQAVMPDALKLDVMRLEVMKDQFKSKASELQRRNSLEISSLS